MNNTFQYNDNIVKCNMIYGPTSGMKRFSNYVIVNFFVYRVLILTIKGIL